MTDLQFIPVLLGTGANAYGLAEGLYKAYRVTSICLGPTILLQTRYSRIVRPRLVKDLTDDARFVPELMALADELDASRPGVPRVIIACADTSAALLAHHRDELRERYLVCSIDGATLDRAVDKVGFAEICREAGVPTPITAAYTYDDFRAGTPVPEPAAFPLELKAADSVAYLDVDFPGRRKAYTIGSRDELNRTARAIYEAGYRGALVIQEFIPGSDGEMRTLNAYVNSDGSIAMMSLGNPIMEEYAPARIGNYAAIIAEGDDDVYDEAARLLTSLHYTGYANFDMKRDPRDNTFKFLELNPRPGGSSDFTSQAGLNLASWIVRDLLLGERGETVRGRHKHLWLGVPRFVVRRFAPEGAAKYEALALMKLGRTSRSAFYWRDMNPRRLFELARWQFAVTRDFYRYAPKR